MTDMLLLSGRRRGAHLRGATGLVLFVAVLALGGWIWLFPAGPAGAQVGDAADLASRLERLESQVQALRQQLDRSGSGPSVGASGEPIAPTQAADFEIRLSQLERSVQEMVGKYEEAVFGVAQVRDRLEKLSTDLDFRLSALESKGGGSPSGAAAPPHMTGPSTVPPAASGRAGASAALGAAAAGSSSPATPTAPPAQAAGAQPGSGPGLGSVPGNIQEQYDLAFGLLRKADYEQAEKALSAFVAQHQDSPLAGNAQYWLGETFYVRGKFAEAAVAFAEGFQKYPKGAKAPDNLLKLGMALASLNQKGDACKTFDQLAAQFPGAPASLKRRAEQEHSKLGCP